MDIGSVIGLVMSFGLILAGNAIEGGHLKSIIQGTAAMIVIGGTAGACILQFPLSTSISALKSGMQVFLHKKVDPQAVIVQIVDFAKRARREGILALEKELPNITDPFFAKALRMAVDGLEPKQVVETMEIELMTMEEEGEGAVKFWEAAGGYSPTVGIIGAVLGLIHVMSNLSQVDKLGEGIATAFVATIYGVAIANLICLPFSTKLKILGKEHQKVHELTLKGVLLIQEGVNHTIIEDQLKSFLSEKEKKHFEASHSNA